MQMDSEAFLYCYINDVNLLEVNFLDFRKYLYKKYYNKEEEDEN